jgi:phosphoglycerate kinase
MKTLKNLSQLRGKKVIVRVDFNVPLKEGKIRDDNRIVQALPTILELIKQKAKVILMSHLGKVDHKDLTKQAEDKKKNSLQVVAIRLADLLKQPVTFSPETSGEKLKYFVSTLEEGGVLLVQNTRFEKGEEKNDVNLSKEWASYADAYVMDAFGSAHRAHASTYGIPSLLKQAGLPVAVGYLVEKEVLNLNKVVTIATRPALAILGGLKVSDKIKVIDQLLKKYDRILIGGAMAYTFLKALGRTTGTSPVELDQLDYAKRILNEANGKLVLPLDFMVSDAFEGWTTIATVEHQIPDGMMGMDIGPKTQALYSQEILNSKTLFWNGPMGVFEKEPFTKGTRTVCEAVKLAGDKLFSVCGGGDSAAAVKQFGFMEAFAHVSTGGGASLEMIENEGSLPGIDIIKD